MGVVEGCPQFVDWICKMPSLLLLVAAVLFPISFMIVQAQIFQCLNGGAGPCIDGVCMVPSQRCINTTLGELCCEISQIAPLGVGVGGVTTSKRKLSCIFYWCPCFQLQCPVLLKTQK
ncbi:hypothetical protein GCK32_007314, partial [Trichostrongylus colubriformis]